MQDNEVYKNIVIGVGEKWEAAMKGVKQSLGMSQLSYQVWLETLSLYKVDDDVIYILTPLKAFIEYLIANYEQKIQEQVSLIAGKKYSVKIINKNMI